MNSIYGNVNLQPFNPTWLEDLPGVVEHLDAEHVLHVKGKDDEGAGLTWHTEKFKTDMDIRMDPDVKLEGSRRAGFQMKLGYFEISVDQLDILEALSFLPEIRNELAIKDSENKVIAYRFFVHPSAYQHFNSLHEKYKFVTPDQSEFMGTPTSSYRSWAVRHVNNDGMSYRPAENSTPFVVKMGVDGDSDRWLSYNEIDRSVKAQVAFDSFANETFKGEDEGELVIFQESFGIKLKDYPQAKKSGVIIRQFPKKMLSGDSRILSLAALISPERLKPENRGDTPLPLIYEVIDASVKAGKVKDTKEFVEKYLIKMYLDSIKKVVFEEGMVIEPHSQNLSIVLNPDLTPKGFAYRDHGGIWIDLATRGMVNKDIEPFYRAEGGDHKIFKPQGAISSYIGFYSWFYRYQVFVKTLNIITRLSDDILSDYTPPPIGAPYQIGVDKKLEERNLHRYCVKQLKAEGDIHTKALEILNKYSLSTEEAEQSLKKLDRTFYELLDSYFDLDKVNIPMEEGAFPSAEGGSENQQVMYNHHGFLGKQRFKLINPSDLKISFEKMPKSVMEKIEGRIITSFEKQKIKDLNPKECILASKGICFLNQKNEIVGFSPFINYGEDTWIKNQILEAKKQK